jgi:hypothetical protein
MPHRHGHEKQKEDYSLEKTELSLIKEYECKNSSSSVDLSPSRALCKWSARTPHFKMRILAHTQLRRYFYQLVVSLKEDLEVQWGQFQAQPWNARRMSIDPDRRRGGRN